MKLHLGCGQRYLDGYLNIDFPPSSHSVQKKSVADIQADIRDLRYKRESIEEIRLHHVFEHFPRPVACALLAGWHSWLKPGGILQIEVPDFKRTAAVILNPLYAFKRQAVAERHLFGSHEAAWAVHCEGYTPRILKRMVIAYGFKVIGVNRNSWMGTFNFELFSKKKTRASTITEFERITENYLSHYLLNDQESKLLEVWMGIYRRQMQKSFSETAAGAR